MAAKTTVCMHLGHLHSWVLVGQVRSSANAFVLSAGQNLSSTERAIQRVNAPFTALSLGVVAALHELSAILYAQGEVRSRAERPHGLANT